MLRINLCILVLFFLQSATVIRSEQVENSTVPLVVSDESLNSTSQNVTSGNATLSQPKGLVNHAGRSMNILPQPGSSLTSTATSTSSSSIVVILVSLIVVACVIALIVAALFVMRRRFDFLRLNGSGKQASDVENVEGGADEKLVADAAQAVDTVDAVVKPAEVVVSEVAETAKVGEENTAAVVASENLTSVENTQAVVQVDANVVEPAVVNKVEEVAAVVEPVVESVVPAPVVAATPAVVTEQVSSTSLIANVLSDLSESVVSKLTKPVVESEVDPEKQPLNSEQ